MGITTSLWELSVPGLNQGVQPNSCPALLYNGPADRQKGNQKWAQMWRESSAGDQAAPRRLSLTQSEQREMIHFDPAINLELLARCRFSGWLVDYFFPSWVERVTLCFKKALSLCRAILWWGLAGLRLGWTTFAYVWGENEIWCPYVFPLPPSKDSELKGVF